MRKTRKLSRARLSPTRPPGLKNVARFWKGWTDRTILQLGWTLLSEDGTPVRAGGR